jgi:MinD superfamily P-loop ATPase
MMVEAPQIDQEKCNGCGLCIDVCAHTVLALVDRVATVTQPEQCNWCTDCEAVCAQDAIACSYEIVLQD